MIENLSSDVILLKIAAIRALGAYGDKKVEEYLRKIYLRKIKKILRSVHRKHSLDWEWWSDLI